VAAELVASQFDTVAAAAEGCDALVATGLMPVGQRSIAEILGIHYVCVAIQPGGLPSPHGTTTTATRAGAPQVVVPQIADQPHWAGRVADLEVTPHGERR
jgi:vancomycin aglycone glucosyltransferase